MIISLRALFVALLTLGLTPVSNAADSEMTTAQGSAAGQVINSKEVPIAVAAEGVDASVVATEVVPTAVQLPFDLKAAADIAIAAFGGEVLKAEQIEDETGIRYAIRIINDGRVRDVVVDAANGEIIKPLDAEVVNSVSDPVASGALQAPQSANSEEAPK